MDQSGWKKIDASDWHTESAGGADGAAGAHIAYWYAWMIENDLHSGFICTDSDDLIESYFHAVSRFAAGDSGSIVLVRGLAEELNGSMLSPAGDRFTAEHYQDYLDRYAKLFHGGYAQFSEENYQRARRMMSAAFGDRLPRQVPDQE